ncbi:DUF3566 domain-containing protein [bacterium]|nr:DUF3566 domain-containing protein [bacterium]
MEDQSKLVEIKSINAWSVFKLALIAYLVIGLIVGVIIGLIAGLAGGLGAMSEFQNIPYAGSLLGATGGFAGGLLLGMISGLLYGFVGGIGVAIAALLYDLFAAVAGGVKIRLKDGQ